MGSRQQSAVGNVIRTLADCQRDQHASDRDLLIHFVQERDERAFAVLVRRHAPMVIGVALRVLHHHQDAEDVCQATFLLLARQAKRTAWRESIANWLYRAAYQLALKAQRAARRRTAREGLAEAGIAGPAGGDQRARSPAGVRRRARSRCGQISGAAHPMLSRGEESR